MNPYNFNEAGPITQEFLLEIKNKCMYHSYGNFEGFKIPSLSELYSIRDLIDGAIEEQKQQENS